MLTTADRQRAADDLLVAERDRRPIAPLTESLTGIDVDDAYQIQLLQIQQKIAGGAVVRGHKVGLSARAMQQMLGVDEPDYGHLLDTMLVFEDEILTTDEFCAPRVEPEVAFVLGEGLRGPAVNVADVLRATAFVVPALEVIDSRIMDWRIKLPDTVADNASSARVVLGGRCTPVDGLDLRLIGALLSVDGDIVETGATGAVLGNPAKAVAWLANKIYAYDMALEAGHVIMPGSCTRAVSVTAGTAVRADFAGLGSVGVRFS